METTWFFKQKKNTFRPNLRAVFPKIIKNIFTYWPQLLVRVAYRWAVVQVLHGPEEIQTLGGAEFALLHRWGVQRVQDFLQQVHLAGAGGVHVQFQGVGVVTVLGVRGDVPAVLWGDPGEANSAFKFKIWLYRSQVFTIIL